MLANTKYARFAIRRFVMFCYKRLTLFVVTFGPFDNYYLHKPTSKYRLKKLEDTSSCNRRKRVATMKPDDMSQMRLTFVIFRIK